MNINDGLYPNANPGAVRNGVKSFALNIMYNDDGNTLINENGFEVYKKDLDVYGTLVGKIEVPLGVILFFKGTPDKIVYIYQTTKDKDDITTYSFEAWHYRYLGVELAQKIKASNLTFDEYYVRYLESNNN